MKGFEQFPQGEQMPDLEVGSRPSIHQVVESHFGESYDSMVSALRTGGDSVLGDFVTTLSDGAKEKLAAALNENGRDWRFLARLGKENSPAVVAKLAEWEGSVKTATDPKAIRGASRSLVNFLEEI